MRTSAAPNCLAQYKCKFKICFKEKVDEGHHLVTVYITITALLLMKCVVQKDPYTCVQNGNCYCYENVVVKYQ